MRSTAALYGVSVPQVWNWRYGRRPLSAENARRLRADAERLSQELAALAYELRADEPAAAARRSKRRAENQRRWAKWRSEDEV